MIHIRKKFMIVWCCLCMAACVGLIYWETSCEENGVVINEVCNNNFSNYADAEGNYFSWVELYNTSNKIKSLKGYELTNSKKDEKYVFGDIELRPYEYVTVFFGDKDASEVANTLYADFELQFEEEIIYLSDGHRNLLDVVEVPELDVNWTYARINDGGDIWKVQNATPLKSNDEQTEYSPRKVVEYIQQPVFSVTSGFYDEAFELAMEGDKTTSIYYTLDGNVPDENSRLYTGEILIDDASSDPNVWAMREDTTAQFFSEKYMILPLTLPEGLIDKATIVRAVCIDEYGNCSEVSTATYFVGFQNKEGYEDLDVVSIVSDQENIFGYEKGIYVTGRVFDGIQLTDDWLWQNTNYRNKGRSAEREAHFEFFDQNHEMVLSKDAGIRIRGKGTRAYLQKSFNLYARDEYDGEAVFAYDFWGDEYMETGEVSLSSGGNDIITKLRDYLVSDLSANLNFSTLKHRPCAVFLNGEYWGMYYVTEKFNAQYISKNFGISQDNVVMIRNWEVEEGTKNDLQQLHDDMAYIGAVNLSVQENYQKVCDMIDIDSVIDYYAFQVYIARGGDWLGEPHQGGNWGVWKSKTVGEAPYEDGKWRWLLFDANSSSMENAEFDSLSYINEKSYYNVFPNLMTNEQFKIQFYKRLSELSTSVFETGKVSQTIDERAQNNKAQVLKTLDRYYYGFYTEETYNNAINQMKTFFEKRFCYIKELTEKNRNGEKELQELEFSG